MKLLESKEWKELNKESIEFAKKYMGRRCKGKAANTKIL
jgi:hypothetical protein